MNYQHFSPSTMKYFQLEGGPSGAPEKSADKPKKPTEKADPKLEAKLQVVDNTTEGKVNKAAEDAKQSLLRLLPKTTNDTSPDKSKKSKKPAPYT